MVEVARTPPVVLCAQADHFELSIFFNDENAFITRTRGIDIFKDDCITFPFKPGGRLRRVISDMQDSAARQSTDLSARDLKAGDEQLPCESQVVFIPVTCQRVPDQRELLLC